MNLMWLFVGLALIVGFILGWFAHRHQVREILLRIDEVIDTAKRMTHGKRDEPE